MWKTTPCGEGGEKGNGREGRVVSTRAFGGGNGWERRNQKIPWAILDISKVTSSCCCSYLTHWLCQHVLPCARSSHRSCGRFAGKSLPNRAPLPECRVGDVKRRTRLWSGYVENNPLRRSWGRGGMVGRGGSSRLVRLAVVMGGRDATNKSPQGGQKFAPHSVMAYIPPSPLRILTGRLSHLSG